jgi:flagellar hook assembly protein FlgD
MKARFITAILLPVATMMMLLTPQSSEAGNSTLSSRLVHPNPFTEGTTFQLTMPKSARIRISVYNVRGELMRTLFEGEHPQGDYDIPWDGKDLNGNPVPAGVYVCVLYSENVAVKSVKVIKAQT